MSKQTARLAAIMRTERAKGASAGTHRVTFLSGIVIPYSPSPVFSSFSAVAALADS